MRSKNAFGQRTVGSMIYSMGVLQSLAFGDLIRLCQVLEPGGLVPVLYNRVVG